MKNDLKSDQEKKPENQHIDPNYYTNLLPE